jgi:hypothetical protein
MNILIDTFLSKVENAVSRPGRLMGMADALLEKFASKDVASAAPLRYVFTEIGYTPCLPRPTCSPIQAFKTTKKRVCNCGSSGCICGSWLTTGPDVCC